MNAADTIRIDQGSMNMKGVMQTGAPSPAREIAKMVPAGRRYGYGAASIVPYLVQSLQAKVVPTMTCAPAAPESRRRSRTRPGK